MKKVSFSIFAILILMNIQAVYAQDQIWNEEQPFDESSGWEDNHVSMQNGVDCFDYYTFQSVQVSVNADRLVSQYGDTILFSGSVNNENTHPIVDGNVYVRISKYNEEFNIDGHYIVDEFIAVEDVNLSAKEVKNIAFEWVVPEHLTKGDYNIDLFFSVGKKFNLGGLPFSNEIIAGSTTFVLDSIKEGDFSFERSTTKFNGEKYYHIGNWPVVEKGNDSIFTYYLKNTFDYDVKATVAFNTYNWDSLHEQDLIKAEEIVVDVPANTSEEINYYVANDGGQSVYYLQTTAKFNDTKSIINTRFSVLGGEVPRLNYPAITKFPVEKGDELTVFTCFHNTTNVNTRGVVEVKLLDAKDNIIKVVRHEGIIPSVMSAIKEDVIAQKDYDYLKLQATMKNTNGDIVDEYETVYSCEKFDKCDDNIMKVVAYIILAIITFLVILVIVKIVKNKKGLVGAFFMIIIAGTIFVSVNQVSAASVTSSKSYTHGHLKSGIFTANFASGNVSANHIINGASSMVCDGSVSYSYSPTLTFNASGGSWDTPYGKFCNNYTSASCFGSNIVRSGQRITSSSGRTGYIYWTGKEPVVTLTSSNTNILTCSGMKCTAKPGQSGTVRVTANVAATPVKIWSAIQMKVNDGESLRSAPSEGFWGTPDRYRNNHKQTYFYLQGSDGSIGVASGKINHGYSSTIGSKKTNKMSLPAKSVSWNVTVGACEFEAKCGSREGTYSAETTAYPAGSVWCNAATSTPAGGPYGSYFPEPGEETTWKCQGNGGGDTIICAATREGIAEVPTCSLKFSPSTITAPGSATVTLKTTNATSTYHTCTGPNSDSNNHTLPSLNGTWPQDFTADQIGTKNCDVTVYGPGGQSTCSGSINVKSTPTPTGSCGTANKQDFETRPTIGLCTSGTARWTDTEARDNIWDWYCGNDRCWADKVTGVRCGSATGQQFDSKPVLSNEEMCALGYGGSVNIMERDEDYWCEGSLYCWYWFCQENNPPQPGNSWTVCLAPTGGRIGGCDWHDIDPGLCADGGTPGETYLCDKDEYNILYEERRSAAITTCIPKVFTGYYWTHFCGLNYDWGTPKEPIGVRMHNCLDDFDEAMVDYNNCKARYYSEHSVYDVLKEKYGDDYSCSFSSSSQIVTNNTHWYSWSCPTWFDGVEGQFEERVICSAVDIDSCGSAHEGSYTSTPTENLCNNATASWIDEIADDKEFNWDCGTNNCTATKTEPLSKCGTCANIPVTQTDWNNCSFCIGSGATIVGTEPSFSTTAIWSCQNADGDITDCGTATYCTQKACTANNICQSTPKPASDASECSSTCNSNSDCSSGRLIETRP